MAENATDVDRLGSLGRRLSELASQREELELEWLGAAAVLD
jgi:hypothetical protein